MKKKVLTLLLAVTMAMAVPMTAFATGTDDTAAATDISKHTFTAYQIFTGTYSEDTGKLSDANWASGVDETVQKELKTKYLNLAENAGIDEVLTAFKAIESKSDDANKIAAYLAQNTAKLGTGIAVEDGDELGTDAAGYYIVVDTTSSLATGDTYNAALLQTDGTIKITDKHDTVDVEKEIKDKNDSNGTETEWQKYADYDIGDDVPFRLTGTLPTDSYDLYDTYYYAFHDIESAGLTFDDTSVRVYVGDENGSEVSTDYYEVVTSCSDGCTFEIVFDDLKEVVPTATDDTKITVTYKATLNDEAVIGSAGNPNEVFLEYSNNPSAKGTGETVHKTVIAFTYKVLVNKTDETGDELGNAAFALYKFISGTTAETDTTYTYNNGTENKIYTRVKEYTAAEDQSSFAFEGIDDGEYLLVETATPDGYNTIDPIAFTVTTSYDTADKKLTLNGAPVTTGEITFTRNTNNNDALEADVVNYSGSLLPSTGGIGTTIFYVVGGILIVGAGVLLFVKTRTKK